MQSTLCCTCSVGGLYLQDKKEMRGVCYSYVVKKNSIFFFLVQGDGN